MKTIYQPFIAGLLIFMSALLSLNVQAAQKEAPLPETFATHKVVLQISDPEPFKQTLVLNVAANLQKYYGPEDVDLEIVGFGPGLRLMLDGNSNAKRIKSMMDGGIRFSGCANTLEGFAKQLGHKPKLLDGVQLVPAGAGRILQLNAAGYQILKP